MIIHVGKGNEVPVIVTYCSQFCGVTKQLTIFVIFYVDNLIVEHLLFISVNKLSNQRFNEDEDANQAF